MFVPSTLADPLLQALAPVVRLSRARVSPDVLGLLVALAEAAQDATAPRSPTRTAQRPPVTLGEPAWLTTQEVADRIGSSRRAAQLMCSRGQVRCLRRGRAWFIDPASLPGAHHDHDHPRSADPAA